MGATACGGKADSISMPHSSTNMKMCLVVHCDPGRQKLTEVYEIYPELTGEVLAHDIDIIFLVSGSRNLQQMTKMSFSSLLFVLEFMVRNITAFYSGWMLVHRDPKRAATAPLTKGQSWTEFCVQLMLGTSPGPVWNKEATQNGFGPCGSPFHGNEEWHLLQQLWCKRNWQLSYSEKKTALPNATVRTLLRRLIRTRTHGEMVISTDRFLRRWCICGQSTDTHIVINYT